MKKSTKKKREMTIDDLALMTQRGFDGLEVRMGKGFTETKSEFTKVNERLDVVEHLLIGRHDKRLDKLEDDMRVIKTMIEKKLGSHFSKK